ncbi:porin, partial [Rhizobium phaseoli]
YQIVDNLSAKVSVQYLDPDNAEDVTSGYFRLQRAF